MAVVNTKGTALITGAASGIGATYAHRLARQGHDLLLAAPDRSPLERLARWLRKETAVSIETMVVDLAGESDLAEVEERLLIDGNLTLLVNNSGTAGLRPRPGLAHVGDLIRLNVAIPAQLSLSAAGAFGARGGGTIITVAPPVAAPAPLPGTEDGGRSLLLTLVRVLDEVFRGRGVRAQLVLPDARSGPFWALAQGRLDGLAPDVLLLAEEMVDAALEDVDRQVLISRSSLPRIENWERFEERAARGSLASLGRPILVELS